MPGARSSTRHNYSSSLCVYANYDPPGTGTDTLTTVAELVSASLTGAGHGEIDVTHLFSPDGFKELLPGWGEGGEFSLKFNYNPEVWVTLETYTPDITTDQGPAWGRRRIDLVDAGGNFITARVKFSIPTRELGDDGKDVMNVTCKVMEGRPTIFLAF